MTTNFFSPLSFVAVFGSEIRDPGWVKIRIRDPGETSRIRNTELRVPTTLTFRDCLLVSTSACILCPFEFI
jgi:hypothetical protein